MEVEFSFYFHCSKIALICNFLKRMKFELYSHFLRKWRCTMSTQTSTLYTFLKKTENDNAVNENTLENAIFKFLKICSANGIFYLIVILVFNQCYSRCTFSISQNHIETTRTKTHWEKLFIYSLSTSHKLFEIDFVYFHIKMKYLLQET